MRRRLPYSSVSAIIPVSVAQTKGAEPMRSARGRFRVLSSLFVASLLLTLFGSAAGAADTHAVPAERSA